MYLDEDFAQTDGRRAEFSQEHDTLEVIALPLPPELKDDVRETDREQM